MAALARLPVFVALEGRRALVAGGTAAAAWKVELLSAAGAAVNVHVEEPSEELLSVVNNPPRGPVCIHRRAWTVDDIVGAAIAIGAFDNDAQAATFAKAARTVGVPVNVIDMPAYCDFSFGSIVNRSPLVIGISTGGAAPVFAQAIRAKIEALLPMGFARWAATAARWRVALKVTRLSFAGRRRFWQLFTARVIANPETPPTEDDFARLIAEVSGLGDALEAGTVTLVGAGPGDPELLTLHAVRALQSADVILFDDLVSHDVLDFARREAKRMLVGKTGYGPSCRQHDINRLMVNLARSGKRVVRLKGGDPLIFGRASEEIAACEAAGIAVEIVPGISAAQGAAARLGIPLTDRNHARRLQYLTAHAQGGTLPTHIDWHALADPETTTAVYMPTRTIAALVAQAVTNGLSPDTPAVAIANATRPEQQVIAETIVALPDRLKQATPEGPVLVMIGQVCSAVLRAQSPQPLRSCTPHHDRPRGSTRRMLDFFLRQSHF